MIYRYLSNGTEIWVEVIIGMRTSIIIPTLVIEKQQYLNQSFETKLIDNSINTKILLIWHIRNSIQLVLPRLLEVQLG